MSGARQPGISKTYTIGILTDYLQGRLRFIKKVLPQLLRYEEIVWSPLIRQQIRFVRTSREVKMMQELSTGQSLFSKYRYL